jgi:Mn-dependent DtxR family transcriptional regulator
MSRKREQAREAAERARAAAAKHAREAAAKHAREAAAEQARAAEAERAREAAAERARAAAEVIPWLRRLGFRADEARRAAETCENLPTAPLEARVRAALSYFARPPHGRAARILQTAT